MKKFSLLILALMLITVSCKRDKRVMPSAETIRPLSQSEEVINLDSSISETEVIPLSEDITLGVINKVLVMEDGRVVVKSNGKVALIGKDGKFIKNISARGRAANEYTSLHDIALSHDEKSVMILDERDVLIVDIESGAAKSVSFDELKYPVDAFAPCKDGGIFLFSFYPVNNNDSSGKRFLLSKIDSSGKVVENYFEKDDITFSIDCISQSEGNRYFLRPQNSDHIFYDLTTDEPTSTYRIDFEDKNIPHRYYYDVANEDMHTYIFSPYFKFPTEMCETDDILSFKASDDKNEWNYIYSKGNKRGISWKNGQDSPSTKIFTSDSEGYFYTFISVDDIENYDSQSRKPFAPLFSHLSKRVKEQYDLKAMKGRTFIVRVKFALVGPPINGRVHFKDEFGTIIQKGLRGRNITLYFEDYGEKIRNESYFSNGSIDRFGVINQGVFLDGTRKSWDSLEWSPKNLVVMRIINDDPAANAGYIMTEEMIKSKSSIYKKRKVEDKFGYECYEYSYTYMNDFVVEIINDGIAVKCTSDGKLMFEVISLDLKNRPQGINYDSIS